MRMSKGESNISIIEALQETGDYCSGEDLAQEMGISRTAVWKRINLLRDEGFQIEAVPKRGYRLVSCPEKLLPLLIQSGLRTTTIGKRIYYQPVMDSTNDVARKLAEGGAGEGTVVVCEVQTRGKGRCGKAWVSPDMSIRKSVSVTEEKHKCHEKQNVLFSVILRDSILPQYLPRFAIIGALSAAQGIRRLTGLGAQPKWPNEVMLHDRKVGGVLVEFGGELDSIGYVILGVGVNVNFDPSKLSDITTEATSISRELGTEVSRLKLLQTTLEQLEENYHLLKKDKFEIIQSRWSSIHYEQGKQVRANTPEGIKMGIARGIDTSAALIISNEAGEESITMGGNISVSVME